jgi:hypothetical protein
MKSPEELSEKLSRQWRQKDARERRLLSSDDWPWELAIGMPDASVFAQQSNRLSEHLRRWRAVTVGEVLWKLRRFREGSEPIELPFQWRLRTRSQWIEATGSAAIQQEYERLARLVAATDPMFHRWLVRQHSALLEKSESELIQSTQLALALSPGCAAGVPLRAVSMAGIDSKFFERHRRLMIQLLDIRFDNQASKEGLENFLDALNEGDHWLLVAPLAPALLPFSRQRVRASELLSVVLPASHILIVENERCLHQLPVLSDTIAILGSGLHLEWMQAAWLSEKSLGYWGDMDTWGLKMLAKARSFQPGIQPLLMGMEIFESHRAFAVEEPHPYAEDAPHELAEDEKTFFNHLRESGKGRLEQEFLPRDLVAQEVTRWRASSEV